MTGQPYLAMATLIGDHHAELLEEWIEFHRLVGAERFFVYSTLEANRAVLAPYERDDTVVVHDWPIPFPPAIGTGFTHCVREHRGDSRWIAFVDVDEFLFSPTLRPLPEVLPEFERWPAVGAVTVTFGTSGHVQQPPGLVIDNFRYRGEQPEVNSIKCILDPARTERCIMAHQFEYTEGTVVDELHRPVEGYFTKTPSTEKLRINHYWTLSQEAAERKFEQWSNSSTDRRQRRWFDRRAASLDGVLDETILPYVPRLRDAMKERTGSA